MNVSGFIAAFRLSAQDAVAPYLWSDVEIVDYLNDAINEACERALLIEDRVTPAVCSITLVAGQSDYTLHASIIKVKRLTFRGRALTETSVEAMDDGDPQWESRAGEPRQYILAGNHGLRMIPTPTVGEAIALTVYRTPVAALAVAPGTATPEIPERHHQRLMDWVRRCAYLKPDSEVFDKAASERYEAAFEGSFGARIDANVQRKHRDRRPHKVRFSW